MAPSSSQLGPALPTAGKFFVLAAPSDDDASRGRLSVPLGFGSIASAGTGCSENSVNGSRAGGGTLQAPAPSIRKHKQWFPQVKKSGKQLDIIAKMARASVRSYLRAARAGLQEKLVERAKLREAAAEVRAKRCIAEEQERVAMAAREGLMAEKQAQLFNARMQRMRAHEDARRRGQDMGALTFLGAGPGVADVGLSSGVHYVHSAPPPASPTAGRFYITAGSRTCAGHAGLSSAPDGRGHGRDRGTGLVLDVSHVKDERSWQEIARVDKAALQGAPGGGGTGAKGKVAKVPKESAITKMMKQMMGLAPEPESDEEEEEEDEEEDDTLSPLKRKKKGKKGGKKGRRSTVRRRGSKSPARRQSTRSPGKSPGRKSMRSPSKSAERKSLRNSVIGIGSPGSSPSRSASPGKLGTIIGDISSEPSPGSSPVPTGSPKRRKSTMRRRSILKRGGLVDDIVID